VQGEYRSSERCRSCSPPYCPLGYRYHMPSVESESGTGCRPSAPDTAVCPRANYIVVASIGWSPENRNPPRRSQEPGSSLNATVNLASQQSREGTPPRCMING
jgi:hypothetical protein